MQESYAVNSDILLLSVLINLRTLVLEAVESGWTMCTVWDLKLPLQFVHIGGGVHTTVVIMKMHLSFVQVSSDHKVPSACY